MKGVLRLMVILSLAAPALAHAAPAVQLFTYQSNSEKPRVCRGDTATGVATCVDKAAATAKVKAEDRPAWTPENAIDRYHLRYDLGDGSKGAGTYHFFAYYSNKGLVRVCAGNTARGTAVCADGAGAFATTRGSAAPKFTPGTKPLWYFRYFWEEKRKPGTFSFASYTSSTGAARICRMESPSGDVVCAGGSATVVKVMPGKTPAWVVDPKVSRDFFRY